MGQPVTRGELLHALQVVQVAMMAQAAADAAIVMRIERITDEGRAEIVDRTVDAATSVLDVIRKLVAGWRGGSDFERDD